MVKKGLGVKKIAELDGATVCVQSGTTTEKNLTDYFRKLGAKLRPVISQDYETSVDGFIKDRCDAFTADRSGLVATRVKYPELADAVILDETMSKEPLAPAVAQGDSPWRDLVSWVIYGLIQAEELGVSQANLAQMLKSDDLNVKRLLGREDTFGADLGVSNDFMARAIKHVGNYGEIYDRHLGKHSPFKLARGLNDLWTRGGLMYSPPLQ
jgi:general L-amino acid transport system substrate-binding protein